MEGGKKRKKAGNRKARKSAETIAPVEQLIEEPVNPPNTRGKKKRGKKQPPKTVPEVVPEVVVDSDSPAEQLQTRGRKKRKSSGNAVKNQDEFIGVTRDAPKTGFHNKRYTVSPPKNKKKDMLAELLKQGGNVSESGKSSDQAEDEEASEEREVAEVKEEIKEEEVVDQVAELVTDEMMEQEEHNGEEQEEHNGEEQEEQNGEEQEEQLPPQPFIGYDNFDAYSNNLLPLVVGFLKVTKQLPGTKDEFDFFQSYPSFLAFTKNQGQRVLQIIGRMFKHHHVYQKWNTTPTTTVTGIEEQTEAVVEANDTLLERVDKILDMMKQSKNEDRLDLKPSSSSSVLVAAWNTKSPANQTKPIRLLHTRNILRPQMKWKDKPDNTDAPFVPHIREKPNAKEPLSDVFVQMMKNEKEDELASFIKIARGSTVQYPHPYQHELEAFEPQPWQLELGLKHQPELMDTTPLTIVDKVEQLDELITALSSSREIAIDLEAHSYRSFLGFTCLMQLSTRKGDYIVDTLSLRGDLKILNKVFTDPNILKVFHGSFNDVLWLQRDLGVYLVNMFDSFHACKQLTLPRASLSFLLHRYCGVTADKQYQLADWRIRPLPDLMIKYAREDTHYLLYIYDCLRYELLAEGSHALESVYRNSTRECMQVYQKPTYSEDSYLDVYHKIRITLKPQQKECLKQLHSWRDQTARTEDESTAFVLPNHMMLKISELLPPDQEGILACCNPPPPIVRLHIPELHLIVEKARHYNPLLDPKREEMEDADDDEYTPGFLDMTHQSVVESLLNVSKRSRRTSEIFYVPKTGPDLEILRQPKDTLDTFSITSETGTIRHADTTVTFFETARAELSDAVKTVTEGMAAPFRLFMNKIAELREEEKKREEEGEGERGSLYPLPAPAPPPAQFSKEGEEDVDEGGNLIVFKAPVKRPPPPEGEDPEERGLRAKSGKKRRKKEVGEFSPFSFEEVSMKQMAAQEEVIPRERGDMLNAGEDSRASSIKQRTNMKTGNRSSFQNFLKKKFRR